MYASAKFILTNLQHGSTQAQAVQFIGASINTYCPEQIGVLQRAAAQ